MNRRTFLQVISSLIPASLSARLPMMQAVNTPKAAVFTTPKTWAHSETLTTSRFNELVSEKHFVNECD